MSVSEDLVMPTKSFLHASRARAEKNGPGERNAA